MVLAEPRRTAPPTNEVDHPVTPTQERLNLQECRFRILAEQLRSARHLLDEAQALVERAQRDYTNWKQEGGDPA